MRKTSSRNARAVANEDQLSEIPVPRRPNINQKDIIPACLELNETSHDLMQAHIDLVGLDRHRFLHTVQEQGA